MLNLDIRDLVFWFRQAQKKLIQDQLKAIQAARLSMAERISYEKVTKELERQLAEVELGKNETISENWKELKMLRRR